MHIDREFAFAAFLRRDRTQDGRFVVAVKTTGIYCRPSCPARRPKRENVEFFPDGEAAQGAGYRACRRCLPDDQGRDEKAVEQALKLLSDTDELPTLDDLARAVGYAPHHFQRLFKRIVGVTPAAYGRQLRARRLEQALDEDGDVTGALYEAGYESAAGAYADARGRLGMTPTARKKGGAGERIWFAIADSSLGPVLIAATQKGLCRISFDEGEADLRAHFPHADIAPSDSSFAALVNDVVSAIDDPHQMRSDLPLDVRGTAFQQAVWQALRAIPTGETRTYSEIATAVGRPNAIRAAGTACGDNALAVVIPCHRVVRTDGGLGGYAYGLDRKKALLLRENE
ncbi:MAG: bifunctional DNA-binding transcriptional regulator/O6-methylguanine-DNA methyltransferase Ada [Sphingobium sp.]